MDAYKFWGNLDEARRGRASLKEICTRLGIAYQRIADQRSECRLPKLEDAYCLANELGVSIEFLLTGKDQLTTYPPRVERIAKACLNANDEDLSLVERALRINGEKSDAHGALA